MMPSADSSIFAVQSVGKRFGYRDALSDVSFSVPTGAFTLMLGSNGAGKTTLLKLLSTLMRPSSGTVLFRGESMTAAAARVRQDLGMISHDSRLYLDLTARENLRVFGRLYGVETLSDTIASALAEVRLDDVADVPVRAFSSGMLKRLSIARLRLYRPRVLLLDEPYSGLDQASIALLDEFLAGFQSGGGTTVMVTHQFTAGVALASHALVLHQGKLVYNQSTQGLTPARCAELLQETGAGGAPVAVPGQG
ncbi:MAG TPA: heme ABC exporter ATP-binding protein CcmA [bacterium]|nr:heme ABC exporter ATP-binding protein CcmA [bacterium]